MVYRKAKQKVRRVYSRSKSIFGGNLFKNPYIVGLAAGIAKNALSEKKIIDIENIKSRISKVDGTNPLILFGVGILTKNPIITAIGLFSIVDPPDEEKKEEHIGYSNLGENEESIGYSNLGETEESTGYSNVGEKEEPAEYSNVGESQESEGYSNIGENEKIIPKKRCVY